MLWLLQSPDLNVVVCLWECNTNKYKCSGLKFVVTQKHCTLLVLLHAIFIWKKIVQLNTILCCNCQTFTSRIIPLLPKSLSSLLHGLQKMLETFVSLVNVDMIASRNSYRFFRCTLIQQICRSITFQKCSLDSDPVTGKVSVHSELIVYETSFGQH